MMAILPTVMLDGTLYVKFGNDTPGHGHAWNTAVITDIVGVGVGVVVLVGV